MSLSTRLRSKEAIIPDITINLESLQFESALTPEQKSILYLRARSHAIVVTLCAQATFFIDVFNEGRQLRKQIRCQAKKSIRIFQEFHPTDPLVIGVLGCGHIGTQIVNCLLTYGRVNPNDLLISTRRPETLESFQSKGVDCFYNNVRLVTSVDVVFLCVLPSQLPAVAEEIKQYLSPNCIIFCTTNSLTPRRLKQMLKTTNILQPDIHWDQESKHKPYNYHMAVSTALENRDTVEKTNPYSDEDFIIIPSRNFGDVLLHSFINMCSESDLTVEETMVVFQWAMFGETERDPIINKITVNDFSIDSTEFHKLTCPNKNVYSNNNISTFSKFNLVVVSENGSPLLNKIKENPELKKAFSKRYWEVFEQYIHLTAYGSV